MATLGVWYVRDAELPGGRAGYSAYRGPMHPDGAVVEAAEPGAPLVWRTHAIENGMLRIEIADAEITAQPPVWFTLVDEPRSSPRATNLVAFATDRYAPGTVVDRYGFATAGVPSEHQAGAIRWYPELGIVHQIFVAPEWRRRRVGSMLIYAADAVHRSTGGARTLRSDGRRTDLGEMFVAAQQHPQRFAEHTEVMPPMDPRA